MGGVLVDRNAHVLDASGVPVPGLYAAGEVSLRNQTVRIGQDSSNKNAGDWRRAWKKSAWWVFFAGGRRVWKNFWRKCSKGPLRLKC